VNALGDHSKSQRLSLQNRPTEGAGTWMLYPAVGYSHKSNKLFPVLLLPAFLKRVRSAYASIFALLVFAFYLPFSGAGLHLFDGARNYGRDWSNNASFFEFAAICDEVKGPCRIFCGLDGVGGYWLLG